MNKFVVALGGNALTGKLYSQQLETVVETMRSVICLVKNSDCKIAITHGNGPQVGDILLQNALAKGLAPEQPIYVCVAESQGLLGFMLQTALYNLFQSYSIARDVSAIVTFVEVDFNDAAFQNPSKPIGPFYKPIEAREIIGQNKIFVFKEDAGRGWRRVVASPEPLRILNIDSIRNIFERGAVPIVCGGGGVPVVKNSAGGIMGVDAVIDKDKSSALLSDALDADCLVMLTSVEKVALNFRKSNEALLDSMNTREAEKYLRDNHFAEGSMKPKVEAALRFIRNRRNRRALITHHSKFQEALEGKNGTWIMDI